MSGNRVIHKKEFDYFNYINDPNPIILNKTKNSHRIMTYNVHGFRDCQNKNKYNDIISTIKLIDPDILILEEVFLHTFVRVCTQDQLRNDLIKCGIFFSGFSSCGLNAVFSKYPFTAKEVFLGCDSIRRIPRNALICEFIKNDIIMVGTHLDVFDETGKLRIKQMNIIVDTLNDD